MKKGQLISLDFIMSLVLIVAAMGLVMQLSEIENYNFKDKELKDETQIIGKTAAELLVNSPRIVCELVDVRDENKVLSYLSNCIPEFPFTSNLAACGGSREACKNFDKYGANHREFKPILKEFLGLPENYSCYIKVTGGKILAGVDADLLTDCESSPPALAKNVYAVDLNVVIHNKFTGPPTVKPVTVTKTQYEGGECNGSATGVCKMRPATIKFMVWKND
ncbi:MAG: hypothetical protein ABH850_01330 [Candidatus Micrarchaeota archaeon]|nr:hypothetical protein [Candidatus Micrarchaeota archaeon]